MSDLKRPKGDTYPEVIVLREKGCKSPVDLVGLTLKMEFAESKSSSPAHTSTGVVVDPARAEVSFDLPSAITSAVGLWHYRVIMVDANSRVRTVVQGMYRITESFDCN